MNLTELLYRIPILSQNGPTEQTILHLTSDSRTVEAGSLYIAIKGTLTDGHQFINSAIEKGAICVFCETLPEEIKENISYIQVKNTSETLGVLAANFYENPSEKLSLIGITGTNGKTSVCTFLFDILEELGYKPALISTVECRIGSEKYPSTYTTPDIISLNKLLAKAVAANCTHAFMEVSSHGIHQNRTQGLKFKIGGFTNITHDHLDYHKSFDEYLRVKKQFFDTLGKDAIAITNLDDKNGTVMLQNSLAKKKTFAMKSLADYHGKILELDFDGMLLKFNSKEVWTKVSGKFNAQNLLLAFSVCAELGLGEDESLRAISSLNRVNGRFEVQKSYSGIIGIVDFAHTPDALENVLDSINEIRSKNERLICVFGCGGGRDFEKRHKMGKIASSKATIAIITSDNPRNENPEDIIEAIKTGVEPQNFSKYLCITDRQEAIKTAVKFAEPKDIILIAGKGHENYQEIKNEKIAFNDQNILANCFQIMGK